MLFLHEEHDFNGRLTYITLLNKFRGEEKEEKKKDLVPFTWLGVKTRIRERLYWAPVTSGRNTVRMLVSGRYHSLYTYLYTHTYIYTINTIYIHISWPAPGLHTAEVSRSSTRIPRFCVKVEHLPLWIVASADLRMRLWGFESSLSTFVLIITLIVDVQFLTTGDIKCFSIILKDFLNIISYKIKKIMSTD